MAVKIGSNISSLQAQSRLTGTGASLDQVFERLSSGQRINRASDDAAGLSISSSLDLSARVFSVSKRNVSDVISALSIADSATEELQSITTRQRELATQASSGTFSSKQREALDAEARELTNEYNRVILTTEFNGRQLLAQPFELMTAQVGVGEQSTISYDMAAELAGPMEGGSYFVLDGQENTYVWFTVDGQGSDPRPFSTGTRDTNGAPEGYYYYPSEGIQVDLASTPGGSILQSSVTLDFGSGASFRVGGAADSVTVSVGQSSVQLSFNVDGSNTGIVGTQVAISATWSATQVRDAVATAINSALPGTFSLASLGSSSLRLREQNPDPDTYGYWAGAQISQVDSSRGISIGNIIRGGAVKGSTASEVAQAVTDAINRLMYDSTYSGLWPANYWTAELGSGSGEVVVTASNPGGSNSTGDVSTGILDTEIITPGDGRRDYYFNSNSISYTGNPSALASLLDLNNDGYTDIVQRLSGATAILLNEGDGTFGTRTEYQTIGFTASADLNGDGFLDLVMSTSTRASVLLNNGDGTFGTRTDLTLASSASDQASLSDVNGDGRIDIIQAYGSGSNRRFGVFLNQGGGAFSSAATYVLPASTGTARASVADINGDNRGDLIVSLSGSNSIAVSLNAGNGTFGTAATYAVGSNPANRHTLADLNRDGYLDIVQANQGTSGGSAETVSVLLNQGNGLFGTRSDYTVGDFLIASTTVADMNGDTFLDLIQTNFSSGTVSVLFNNGSGGFGTRTDYALGSSGVGAATVGDMNGDGLNDIVQAHTSGIRVFLNQGGGAFSASSNYSGNYPSSGALISDFDLDGQNDIHVGNQVSTDSFSIFRNQGGGSFASTTLQAKLTFSDARGKTTIKHIDLTTQDSAREAMNTLETRAEKISRQRAVYGSVESRLKAAASVIDSTIINYRSAESRIKDTDVAEDAASMVRLNILKQVGSSVLAQANLEPQIALRLLQGA